MFPTSDQRLRAYAHVLLRHRLAIVATTFLVLALGLVPALLEDPTYAGTSTVRIRADNSGSPFEDQQPDNAQTRSRDLLTAVEIVESDPVRELVAERLGGEGHSFGRVSAELIGFSEVMEIRVEAGSAQAAADAANAYAEVVVEERQRRSIEALVEQSEELRRRSDAATQEISSIDRQLADPATDPVTVENLRVSRTALAAQVLDFSSRADVLDVEAALREGGTEIVERADLSTEAVSPQPIRTGLTAAVLGLLAGIAVAVVVDTFEDKTSRVEDLTAIDPTVPVLAAIPQRGAVAAGSPQEPAVHEAFRYLRTSLRFSDRTPRSLVVTSAVSGEGKSSTAVDLAEAFAESGSRVVLIDGDLRQPSLHEHFDVVNDVGLSTVLVGDATFNEAIYYVQPNVALLTAGPPSGAANELLERSAFARLVEAASAQADLVLVDVPPVLPVADALVAARAVDGVIAVARIGTVRRGELRVLLRRLRDARITVVGFVANDVPADAQYGTYEAATTR